MDDEVEGDDKFLVAARVDWSVPMEKAKLSSVWDESRDYAGGALRYTSAKGTCDWVTRLRKGKALKISVQ